MKEIRKKMIDSMIRLYGFEDERTIEFARIAESWADDADHDKMLRTIVESHIRYSVVYQQGKPTNKLKKIKKTIDRCFCTCYNKYNK